ncbi:hypothetical protein PICMEDRAFT_95957 [Pichia membranifaciens NRRL Y-2026]|uniref:DNA 3'-phosphatase n=1 Tax=Pichia membranifaciens NRRL Y-2026 TaxID=763406 RepID=A0A1E3NSW8_9ASCO|nr:hypothetical protein PICMEDRAFT_95957 [Pichia membranifaciens NRRL Y-2026]ODQ49150.1 hypothetical protein PICMEDRAFT_95957 [Pichia membranifaciens NRRL Y-2026]
MPKSKIPASAGRKNPKVEKKAALLVPKTPISELQLHHKTTCNRKYGFQSLGTHCLRYISPRAKELIESQKEGSSEQRVFHVAAFDLDDTLIKTKTGMKFSRSADDWKWWNENVPKKVADWLEQPFPADTPANTSRVIVVFTNQGSVVNTAKPTTPSKSLDTLIEKLNQIANSPALAGVPLLAYAATRKGAADKKAHLGSPPELHDEFRKPNTGMWKQLQRDLAPGTPALDVSFFVGDAAGRKKDFSDSDVNFARALGLRHIVPEDFFT